MNIGRVGLAAGLVGGVALSGVVAAAPPSQVAPLGGFSLRAQSSVLSVELYEPTIPIPAEPQAELNLAYTRSKIVTGPDGRGTASWLWPGDAVGDGFGTIVGDPEQKWPSQVNARTPDGEEKQELTPGSGMRATASNDGVSAKVNLIGLKAPPDGAPGLPSPPAGAVPVSRGMSVLATAEGVTSGTAVRVRSGGVTATAHTAAKNIRLLGGLITIDAVDTSATSGSNASRATASGLVTVTGVTVAGRKVGIDSKGVHVADQNARPPEVPRQLAEQLRALGIEIEAMPTRRSAKGGTGSLATSGLVITVDTKPLRSKLDTSPLDPIVGLLPAELRDQLNLVLGLGPKLVFTVGEATTRAAASPPAPAPDVPGAGPGAGAGPAGDVPAGGERPGDAAGGGDTPVKRAGTQLPPLGAIPKLLLAGALALAAGIGWGLQRAGNVMLSGTTSCEHGLVSGVPDLRKG